MPANRATAIVLFGPSLRLQDNSALNAAFQQGYKVIPLFCFTPEQAYPKKNAYFAAPAFGFMCETLRELAGPNGPLLLAAGDTIRILGSIVRAPSRAVSAVFENIDVTPYARERSKRIQAFAKKAGILYSGHEDVDIIRVSDEGLRENGEPYRVFTAYYNNLIKTYEVRKPFTLTGEFVSIPISKEFELSHATLDKFIATYVLPEASVHGGRKEAMKRLRKLSSVLPGYGKDRDIPSKEHGTSRLSAAISFGVLSVREVAWKSFDTLGGPKENPFFRELVFRSFYYHNTYHGFTPNPAFDLVPYRKTSREWNAFLRGESGFPIVDAAVRCLYRTGFMHGRLRMIVATFVVRGLGIWWRVGERWFANHLIDYDPTSNGLGGWQWANSSGPSAPPYFRVIVPDIQTKRFDPDREFIKKWLPADYDFLPVIDYATRVRESTAAIKAAMRTRGLSKEV